MKFIEHYLNEQFELTVKYLEDKYDEYNKSLFDNRLPNVPIKVGNRKTSGEFVEYRLINGRLDKIKRLEISKYYKRSQELINAILVHEMIHVFLAVNNMSDKGNIHGKHFLHMVDLLNKKLDFKIPIQLESDLQSEIGEHVKSKYRYVILKEDLTENKKWILVLSKLFPDEIKYLSDYFENNVTKHKFNYYIVISNNRFLLKYPLKRTFPRPFYFYAIDNESQFNEILDTARKEEGSNKILQAIETKL